MFGVLLIHANSDVMRQWLWKDVLNNVESYYSEHFILHAFLSILLIFVICVVIDLIRQKTVETWAFRFVDKTIYKYNLK